MPAAEPVCTIRMPASWSGLPHCPSIMPPHASALTEMPVPPRIRRSTVPSSIVFLIPKVPGRRGPDQAASCLGPAVPGRTGGGRWILVDMTDAAELGAFLKAHRAALHPAALGLPPGVNQRRVPGLRREELAQLAGISVDYLTRLEQGRAKNVSDAILDALARALRLHADEARYM